MSTNSSEYMANWRANRIAKGKCIRCKGSAVSGGVHCHDHVERNRVTAKSAYEARRAAGRCGVCVNGIPTLNTATSELYALCEDCKRKQLDRRNKMRFQ